jgi:hypothetical protein
MQNSMPRKVEIHTSDDIVFLLNYAQAGFELCFAVTEADPMTTALSRSESKNIKRRPL